MMVRLPLLWAALLPILGVSPQPVGAYNSLSNTPPGRRVLIWLYDCHEDTMQALANHSSAFTAVAPAMYAVGFDPAGGAELTDSNAWCSDVVHKYLPDKELWAWVESPDSMNRTHCPNCPEDAVMRELFARPQAYIAAAKAEATKRNITGFQFDFEAPGQANNANKTMWLDTLRFHETFAAALAPQGTLTSVAVMCTANVTGNASAQAPQRFCGNGAFDHYNASASPAILQEMAASAHVQRFVSMGTYSTDMATDINQLDWFMKHFPSKFGYGACPTCASVATQSVSEVLFRFGLARAYGVREVDLFAFSACVPRVPVSLLTWPQYACVGRRKSLPQWEIYWPHLEAFLHCGEASLPSGQCWPYLV